MHLLLIFCARERKINDNDAKDKRNKNTYESESDDAILLKTEDTKQPKRRQFFCK